ncbi:hypothetical protein [Litorilituus lipolyticus]|uniref:Uncharacterized protein n=1 Tax=Litorilituus lipolyticus TaxID=2491017 RepID=A0A502KPY0_9GAMM|nr:hypothetical protein [Litorilituus lipolyticus]TPH13576.1 hypothetical protein EPA86_13315 [Litorilituus lipolyticus]
MKLLSMLLSLYLLVSIEAYANTQVNVSEAFNEMKSLVGVWKKENGKSPNFSVSFELTANGSVLVETWLRKGRKHSFTMYHLDNEGLMATHYCPQGNQPRMKLAKESTIDDLRFKFFDATNLSDLADSHQHSLGFEFSKKTNSILRKESYVSSDDEEHSALQLVRVK